MPVHFSRYDALDNAIVKAIRTSEDGAIFSTIERRVIEVARRHQPFGSSLLLIQRRLQSLRKRGEITCDPQTKRWRLAAREATR